MKSNTAAFFAETYGSDMPRITFISSPNRDARGSIIPDVIAQAKPKDFTVRRLLRQAEREGAELFFAPVPMSGEGMPSEAQAKDAAVIWADVDQDFTDEQRALIERLDATVNESGGVGRHHVFVPLDVPHPPHVIKQLNQALRVALDGDAKQNPASFLRVPGSFNRKGEPVLCRTVRLSSSRQTLPSVRQALRTDASSASEYQRASVAVEDAVSAAETFRKYAGKTAPGLGGMSPRRLLDKANGRFAEGNYDGRHKLASGLTKDLLRIGLSQGEALGVLLECDAATDKWTPAQIAADVARVYSKEVPHQPDSGAESRGQSTSAGVSAEPVVTSADDGGDVIVGDGLTERFPSLDWASAWTRDYSSPDWLLGKFLERGQQIAFVAGGKEGKSLLLLDWSLSLVLGWSFLGDEGKGDGKDEGDGKESGARVLYFDRENNLRDIITRARSLGVTDKDLAALSERFIYKQFPAFDGTLDDPEANAAEQLLAIVDEVKPDVVILDTASRFIKGNENDSAPWLQLYRLVHAPLKSRGVGGVRIDHFGKDETKGARGNSAKAQDVDHVWEMTVKGERKERKPDGEWVVITLGMKRTHTRTGHGDDSFSIVRRGKKDHEGMWADGCTSHELESSQDKFDEVGENLSDAEKIWAFMSLAVGRPVTAARAAEVIGKSDKTAERHLKGFEQDPKRKTQISKGKQGQASAWTYLGSSV
ncbi:AAA family ATPase [Streptomyces sp. NPDC059256]|uniref:AAA family ATPase n=1 Tax=Streptomyces sp. NPDC059256 TaxID=3346794 RepID=UPI0036955DE1